MIKGSGHLTTQERIVSPFTGIQVTQGIEVIISKSGVNTVTIEADDNLINHIITEVKNKNLSINLESNINVNSYKKMTVKIGMPSLDKVKATTAASVHSEDTWNGSKLDLSATTAARISLNIDYFQVNIQMTTSSETTLTGKAVKTNITESTASNLKGNNFYTSETDISLATGSEATLNVADNIGYRLSTGSNLKYIGSPQVNRSKITSGGSVSSHY
ncbi:MAG: DUF2807 domain-containing protein [Odoribacter sp.]|nr:DUF2807 domain-containing protein [Odoribacter sp.]